LAEVLIRDKQKALLYGIFEGKCLELKIRRKAILATFKVCFQMHELSMAIKIWHLYGFVLQAGNAIEQVMQAVVNSFESSPIFLEPKIFILMELFYKLQYEHIDTVLTSIELRFGEIEEDGSNSFLLCNLNPIKTACHMLMLLDLIS
jgi:hypothetical protein